MASSAQIITRAEAPEGTPFGRTVPVWVLSAAWESELPMRSVNAVKIMPKTAEATLFDGSVIKLRRRDAFPPRTTS